jgi:hypothetical protein
MLLVVQFFALRGEKLRYKGQDALIIATNRRHVALRS